MFGIVPVIMHDSNGAQAFILECPEIRALFCPGPKLKYGWIAPSSDAIIGMPNAEGVEFSISVPFERFTELRA